MADAKRFLLMKSEYTVNILWLDAHGSCAHYDSEGSLFHKRYHMKRDEKGLVSCLLCPNGLEAEEWARVFVDEPAGSWVKAYTDYRMAPPKRNSWQDSE